jgi:hypothetical protein
LIALEAYLSFPPNAQASFSPLPRPVAFLSQRPESASPE